jgi:hypothetical protein
MKRFGNPALLALMLAFFAMLRPAQAQEIQNCTLVGRWAEGRSFTVVADGNTVYCGNGAYLQIMDFTDPPSPVVLGRIALPTMVKGLALDWPLIYVADYSRGLRTVDVSDPTAPAEIGALENLGQAYGVAVEGSTAYVAAGSSGLVVVDISDPGNPTEVNSIRSGYSQAVAVSGNTLYASIGYFLVVLDITNRTERLKSPKSLFLKRCGIWRLMETRLCACGNGGLRIIDVAVPANRLRFILDWRTNKYMMLKS